IASTRLHLYSKYFVRIFPSLSKSFVYVAIDYCERKSTKKMAMSSADDFINDYIDLETDPYERFNMKFRNWASNNFHIYILCIAVLLLVLYLVAISAKLFLTCTILRFKRLRTRLNMCILNGCILYILHTLTLVLIPVCLSVSINGRFAQTLYIIALTFCTLYMTFAFVLALDWFTSSYKPSLLRTSDSNYMLSFVYTCTGLYIIMLLFLIVINVLSKTVKLDKASIKIRYALTTANIILFSYLPLIIFHLIAHVITNIEGYYNSSFRTAILYIMIVLQVVPEFLAIGHPILVVYMLGETE
ncbi:hypothetical protein NQ317_004322, partial [Molorchus minor]